MTGRRAARTTDGPPAQSTDAPFNHPQMHANSDVDMCAETGQFSAEVVDQAKLGALIRSAILMLGFAVDDLEKGLWSPHQWNHLADGLDKLVAALRSGNSGQTVIDTDNSRDKR